MKLKFMTIILSLSCLFPNQLETDLPIGLTDEEIKNIDLIFEMGRETDPPPTPIRNISEFERMNGVLIRYPFGISTSIIKEMAEDLTLYCLVSSWSQNSAFNSMNNADVNMDNVEFIIGPTDSYWTRDYGPWWVVDGDRNVSIVDHTYNRPRPNDNDAPLKVSNHLEVPYFASDIIAAGGNYMTDGLGLGASSQLVYEENSTLSMSQVHLLMEDYYGIETYWGIDDPNNTYIDHIDCWGKFLSPSKVLIRSVQTTHAQYDEIEEVAEYFENNQNSYGDNWEVFRVDTPYDQPYTNSIILNEKVMVPIINSSWDDEALAVYQDALPGYEVIPYTGSWESTDALHCRAKGIPDLDMLQIFHHPINDQSDPQMYFVVQTIIDDLSAEGLVEDELNLYWKNSSMSEYQTVPLNICDADIPDCYQANIPAQMDDTTVQYYIYASDYSGRIETLPMAGYFEFDAIGGTPALSGDINQDDTINVLDIVLIVNGILGMGEMTAYQFQLGDMNGDSILNILDIILIVNIIIGE